MYDISGWMNNSGSGTLANTGSYDRWLTESWGGNTDASRETSLQFIPYTSGNTIKLGSTTTTTSTPRTSGYTGGNASVYQYIAPQLLGSTSTTSYSGGKALPTMTAPTFNLPEYDYGRINYLTQQQAAPLYSKARNALTTGIGKIASVDNPYMQGQARKQLMSGYGSGLSEIAAGAAKTAQQLYNTEYGGQMTKATTEYGGQLATAQANFQAALADWQKSLVQTTTTSNQYSSPQTFNTATGQLGGSGTSGVGTGYMLRGVFHPYTSPGYNDERDVAHWNAWKAMIPSGARIV